MIHPNSGDQWLCCCDWGVKSKRVIEDMIHINKIEDNNTTFYRLVLCDDIYSLEFLKYMPELRILEMSEVVPKNGTGFEQLLNLQQLCIWL